MPKKKEKPQKRPDPPSLAPIPFEEAVSDLLKVGPAPKKPKKATSKRAAKR